MVVRTLFNPLMRLVALCRDARFCAHNYWEDRHHRLRGMLGAVGHAQLDDKANETQYKTKRAQITQAINRHVTTATGRTLLDAGCGIGLLTSTFVELGFEVTGVDVSPTGISEAQSREPRARFVVSAIESLHLGRSFDVVVVVDVLLHVVKRKAWVLSLTSLARHVRPGGLLLIVDTMQRVERDKPIHCNWRPFGEFTETMAALGLTPIDHIQFDLEQEGSTKDLVIFQR